LRKENLVNRSPYARLFHNGTRQCANCKKWLEPAAFGPNSRTKDGLSGWCRKCQVARTKQWRADNRAAILAKRRKQWAAHRVELNRHRRELYATRSLTP
jgi:hypothetical protein